MAMKAVKAKWAARKEAKAAAKADKADKAAAEPPVADDEPEEKADKSRMGAFIRRLEASILEERDGLDEEGLAVLAMMSKKYATERLGNDPELAQRVVRAACVSASASATIEKKAEGRDRASGPRQGVEAKRKHRRHPRGETPERARLSPKLADDRARER